MELLPWIKTSLSKPTLAPNQPVVLSAREIVAAFCGVKVGTAISYNSTMHDYPTRYQTRCFHWQMKLKKRYH
jgi:hypothetical protein